MRNTLFNGIVGLALASAGIGGCTGDGGWDDDHHHDYDRGVYRDRYDDRSDYARTAGDRNTRISDRMDDGRLNNSARSYEERKASRAADEGVPGAARREEELRRERLRD